MSYETILFYSVLTLILTFMSITYSKVIEMDHVRNTKLFRVLIVGAILTAFIAWRLAISHFTQDSTYLIHFLMAVLLLFVFPATLFSISVATITSSNVQ